MDTKLQELVKSVVGRHNRTYFPNRPQPTTDATIQATQSLCGLFRSQGTKMFEIIDAILEALNCACDTNLFGDRPYVAADPLLLVNGEQINKTPGAIYLLCAVNPAGVCFPGGFGDPMVSAFETFFKELREEVLGATDPEQLALKLLPGIASDPFRASDRFGAFGLQIVSYLGLIVAKNGAKLNPISGDDAIGFKWVKLFNTDGRPAWYDINRHVWRDDHHGLVARLIKWWLSFKFTNEIGSNLVNFLYSLPDKKVVHTAFQPTPESKPPKTFNLQLATEIVEAILSSTEKIEEANSLYRNINELVQAVVDKLKGWFIPLYAGPHVAVDTIVIGTGKHANHILISQDEKTGEWRLPGRLLRHRERVEVSAAEGVFGKHGRGFTPLMFGSIVPEWLDPTTLRDDREPTMGIVLIGNVTTGQSSKLKPTEKYIPLFSEDRTGVPAEVLRTNWAFHHEIIIKKIAQTLLNLGIIRENENISLLHAVESRGVMF